MDSQDQKHQRRVRYKGTHPKAYKEKYKELQPDKYADTVEKAIQKRVLLLVCIVQFSLKKYWNSYKLRLDKLD